ncbi:MAG: Asp23/Gls24 family envelope stress response protein [Actinobacteria bacterium]|jgi:uncharacterized alkaline shock family protein YloU|nr:Asp23/Gls24 family envelope stress response protein [Actinomycetota bacterium]
MAESQDKWMTGDLPVAPSAYTQAQFTDEEGPSVSHVVIASYVADAARAVPGIVDLRTPGWKGLSERMRETPTSGVVIHDSGPGVVDIEIHARVAWGTVIPELAEQVEKAVRDRVSVLLNINPGGITLFIDEIAGPMEVGTAEET